MNSGPHPDLDTFNSDIQRQLFLRLTRKSANAAGIQAIATLALSSEHATDMTALAQIAALAAELVEGLDDLAATTGQLRLASAS